MHSTGHAGAQLARDALQVAFIVGQEHRQAAETQRHVQLLVRILNGDRRLNMFFRVIPMPTKAVRSHA